MERQGGKVASGRRRGLVCVVDLHNNRAVDADGVADCGVCVFGTTRHGTAWQACSNDTMAG